MKSLGNASMERASLALTMAVLVAVVAINFATLCVGLPQQPDNPIIGVITQPPAFDACVSMTGEEGRARGDVGSPTMPPGGNFSGCVWGVYVQWLQASGIRVIPVPWTSNTTVLDWYFERVNGFLFPGGWLPGDPALLAEYFPAVQHLFDRVVASNAAGDPVVMWGTCQGFELLAAAAARNLSVIRSGFVGTSGPTMMNNNFTAHAASSRMMGTAPREIVDMMKFYNTTLNWHTKGIEPNEFAPASSSPFPLLRRHLVPLSTTNDDTGRTFVSAFEGVTAEIYAVQFHPERVLFEFDNDKIKHDANSIEVAQYFSRFLASRLKLNRHRFDDPVQAEALMIGHHRRVNVGWGIEIYYI